MTQTTEVDTPQVTSEAASIALRIYQSLTFSPTTNEATMRESIMDTMDRALIELYSGSEESSDYIDDIFLELLQLLFVDVNSLLKFLPTYMAADIARFPELDGSTTPSMKKAILNVFCPSEKDGYDFPQQTDFYSTLNYSKKHPDENYRVTSEHEMTKVSESRQVWPDHWQEGFNRFLTRSEIYIYGSQYDTGANYREVILEVEKRNPDPQKE